MNELSNARAALLENITLVITVVSGVGMTTKWLDPVFSFALWKIDATWRSLPFSRSIRATAHLTGCDPLGFCSTSTYSAQAKVQKQTKWACHEGEEKAGQNQKMINLMLLTVPQDPGANK